MTADLRREDGDKVVHTSSRQFLRDVNIWKLCAVYFMTIIGLDGISFWLPSVVKNSGIASVELIGWISAIPYLVAVPTIILTGINADRTRRRRLHFTVTLAVGAAGLALSGYVGQNPVAAVIWLSVGTAGMLSALSLFWGVPCTFLAGSSAAAGIATINCVGNLAGFVSPYMVGWLNVLTGNPAIGLDAVAACMLVGSCLIRLVPASLGDRCRIQGLPRIPSPGKRGEGMRARTGSGLRLRDRQDGDAEGDHGDAQDHRGVHRLAEQEGAPEGRPHHADAGPDRVDDADRQHVHAGRHQPQGRAVAEGDDQAGDRPREAVGGLERQRGRDLGADRQGEDQERVHATTACGSAAGACGARTNISRSSANWSTIGPEFARQVAR